MYLILGAAVITNAQNVDFKKKNFEDQEAFKTALASLKDGDKKFAAKDYSQALVFYKKANDFNSNNAVLNFKMGVSHLKSEEKEKSLDYFLKAKSLDARVDPKIDFAIGQSYQENKQYKTAITTYEGYLSSLSEFEKPSIEPGVQAKIKECKDAGGMDAVTEVKETPKPTEEVAIQAEAVEEAHELATEDEGETPAEMLEKSSTEAPVAVVATAEVIDVEEAHELATEDEGQTPAEMLEKSTVIEDPKDVKPAIEIKEEPKLAEPIIVATPVAAKAVSSSSDVVYKIQLVATSRNLTDSELKKFYTGSKKVEKDQVNGVNKYLVGDFKTRQDALNHKNNIVADKVFIVKYKNGKRIY